MLLEDQVCPACGSRFVSFLQNIYLQRQKTTAPQYFCMECRTFFHISGFKEGEAQFIADAEWLLNHPGDYLSLIVEVKRLFPAAQTCFEVGCGDGTLLHQLATAGFRASGVDTNPVAVSNAKILGVAAEHRTLNSRTDRADLIFCVDVLEHLSNPRALFEEMIGAMNDGGAIIARVPTVDLPAWPYLRGADKPRDRYEEDPFRDNSVHITHFSTAGFKAMASQLGFGVAIDLPGDMIAFCKSYPSGKHEAPKQSIAERARRFLLRR